MIFLYADTNYLACMHVLNNRNDCCIMPDVKINLRVTPTNYNNYYNVRIYMYQTIGCMHDCVYNILHNGAARS